MNTFQLSCFVEVAATLSFSAAARNLSVSQPAVSHNVKALEDELGCSLVSRSTRTVTLTDEGMRYLTYAMDILELADRGARQVSHDRKPEAQVLRIGVHSGLEAMAIAPVIRAWQAKVPDGTPDVRIGQHPALLNMLEGGTLDALLEYRDASGAAAGATVFRRIVDAPAVLLCAPDHPLADAGRIEAEELRGAGRCAACNPYVSVAALNALQRRALAHVEAENVIMCSSVESTQVLAAAGVAFAVMPAAPELHGLDLRAVPIAGLPRTPFGLRMRRGRHAQALDAFLSLLTEHVTSRS